MAFRTDDQRKAAFARMRGSGGGPRPPRNGGPRPPRTGGGPVFSFPNPTPRPPGSPPSRTPQPPWQPSPPGYTYGEGGDSIYTGGVAGIDDWGDTISQVKEVDWYDVAFEGTIFDNDEDPFWVYENEDPYIITGDDAYYLAAENAGLTNVPPPPVFNNIMGGEGVISQTYGWIWDGFHGEWR